jgi:hypothetical protein
LSFLLFKLTNKKIKSQIKDLELENQSLINVNASLESTIRDQSLAMHSLKQKLALLEQSLLAFPPPPCSPTPSLYSSSSPSTVYLDDESTAVFQKNLSGCGNPMISVQIEEVGEGVEEATTSSDLFENSNGLLDQQILLPFPDVSPLPSLPTFLHYPPCYIFFKKKRDIY